MKRRLTSLIPAVLFLAGSAAYAQAVGDPNAGNRRVVIGRVIEPHTVQTDFEKTLQAYGLQLAGGGAWWTNTALMTRLGFTDDQKAKIERTFATHRPTLELNRATLEKEEAQLARLMEAEPFDRNAALSQTYRVIQARSDMERSNALMTLEMREYLTRAQWMQLPKPSVSLSYVVRKMIDASPNPAPAGGARGR
jgi:Spy/CpxP family protein refolding chaperone